MTAARSRYRDTTWLTPKAEVRDSSIEGRGLFALEPIAAGETVIVMGGRIVTDDEFRALNLTKYSAAAIGEGLHILLDSPTPANFGNHSCDANTWMCDEVTTCARRDILPGEEITIDYAVQTASPDWSMPCSCGSPLCRSTVSGADWRLPDVQSRYAGHFSPFLNTRIARLIGESS